MQWVLVFGGSPALKVSAAHTTKRYAIDQSVVPLLKEMACLIPRAKYDWWTIFHNLWICACNFSMFLRLYLKIYIYMHVNTGTFFFALRAAQEIHGRVQKLFRIRNSALQRSNGCAFSTCQWRLNNLAQHGSTRRFFREIGIWFCVLSN